MNHQQLAENKLPRPVNAQRPAPDNARPEVDQRLLIDQLFTAVNNSDLKTVQGILDQDNIDLSVQDENGMTLLHRSIQLHEVDIVFALLNCRHGIHIDARDNMGHTAFTTTINFNDPIGEIMRKGLVEFGADIKLPFTPFDPSTGSPKEISAMRLAIKANNIHAAKLLLGADANINAVDSDPWPLIASAVNYQQADMVKLLADAKADVNATFNNQSSQQPDYSALNLAVQNSVDFETESSFDILKILVDAGSKTDMRSIELAKGNYRILDVLLEKAIDKTDEEGKKIKKSIFDAATSQPSFSDHTENKEIHLVDEQLEMRHFNLARVIAEPIKNSDLKKEFLAHKMEKALNDSNYMGIDALREMGVDFYAKTPIEIQEKSTKQPQSFKEISAATRNNIINEIIEKTKTTAAPEKIAVQKFLYFLNKKKEFGWNEQPISIQDKNIISTAEDKAFFTALMEAQMSPSNIETVVLSKLTFDDSLEKFLENEQLAVALDQTMDPVEDVLMAQACLTGYTEPDFA